MLLELMAELQQLHPVAVQLAGQPRRRDALGDAAEDQDQGRGTTAGLLEGRAGEGVEHPPAVAASVVDDRLAMAAMDAESISAASGAGDAVGVEGLNEAGIAGVLIHEFGQREVHRRCLSVCLVTYRDYTAAREGLLGPTTKSGS